MKGSLYKLRVNTWVGTVVLSVVGGYFTHLILVVVHSMPDGIPPGF